MPLCLLNVICVTPGGLGFPPLSSPLHSRSNVHFLSPLKTYVSLFVSPSSRSCFLNLTLPYQVKRKPFIFQRPHTFEKRFFLLFSSGLSFKILTVPFMMSSSSCILPPDEYLRMLENCETGMESLFSELNNIYTKNVNHLSKCNLCVKHASHLR